MDKIHVLGVAGSLRKDSYNRKLLHAAEELFIAGEGRRHDAVLPHFVEDFSVDEIDGRRKNASGWLHRSMAARRDRLGRLDQVRRTSRR